MNQLWFTWNSQVCSTLAYLWCSSSHVAPMTSYKYYKRDSAHANTSCWPGRQKVWTSRLRFFYRGSDGIWNDKVTPRSAGYSSRFEPWASIGPRCPGRRRCTHTCPPAARPRREPRATTRRATTESSSPPRRCRQSRRSPVTNTKLTKHFTKQCNLTSFWATSEHELSGFLNKKK